MEEKYYHFLVEIEGHEYKIHLYIYAPSEAEARARLAMKSEYNVRNVTLVESL